MSGDRIDGADVYGDPFVVERGDALAPRWRAIGACARIVADEVAVLGRKDALRVGKFLLESAGIDVDKLITDADVQAQS